MPISNHRNFGMDLIRTIAICLVVLSHTIKYIVPDVVRAKLVFLFGYYGVELFFVLSGFLIGTILISNWDKPSINRWKDLWHFWIRRWFRTLPNYYLFLLIYCLIGMGRGIISTQEKLSFIFFVQNAFNPQPAFFSVSWSLSIEEWFYILFPLTILAVHKLISANTYLLLLSSTIIFIFFFNIMRIKTALDPSITFNWGNGYRKIVSLRLDSIAIGVICAFVKYYHQLFWKNKKNIFFVIGIGMMICSLLYLMNVTPKHSFFAKSFFFTFTGVGMALLFPFFYYLECKEGLIKRGITQISLISYSLYLVHILVKEQLPHLSLSNSFFKFLFIWLVSLGLSYMIYHLFEKPIMKYRDRLTSP